ncbi:MAG: two-component regulator propeller domain-containing protein [Breznakibacter sp.]
MPFPIHSFRKFILPVLLFPVTLAYSQSYDFKVFDSNMGLPQNFVYCLAQDHEGFIWIGTGEGLVKYDGIRFKNYTVADSLAGDFIRDIFIDDAGSVWIGHDNGTISEYQRGNFSKILIPSGSSPVRDICQDEEGNIWGVEQNNGIIRIDKNGRLSELFSREKFGRKLYYSINAIDEHNLLVGTSEGLLKVRIGSDGLVAEVHPIGSIPETGINAIVKRKESAGEFWIATEDKGFYLYKWTNDNSQGFSNNKLCLAFNIQNENITDIIEEDESNLLISTWENGVIKLLYDPLSGTYNQSLNFSEANGLNKNNIKDILQDREGNYWFATYGGGVSTLINDHFIYYQLADIGFKNNKVSAVIHFGQELWMGLENGMLKTDPFCFAAHEFYDKYQGIPADVITDFLIDPDKTLWVATSQNGLYKRKHGEVKFSRHPYTNNLLGNHINDIEWVSGKIYIATLGGLYILDPKNGNNLTHLTTEQNLPHNSINFIYKDAANNIWIGPKSSGICKIDIDQFNIEVHRLDQSPVDVSDMTQDLDGKYWLATKGKGILQYSGDSIRTISVQNGLAKNFCHSLECDSHNRLWVAHHSGLSCVDLNNMQIRVFGHENRMGGDFLQIWKDFGQYIMVCGF